MRRFAPFAIALMSFALLALLGRAAPNWVVFLATMAFAKGLVALGLVLLMRGGLVSFGQGLFYCAGAYAAGLAMRWTGDALILVAFGSVAALLLGLAIAPLLAGYRSIFFATLTLALSMMAYGVLNKTYALGGSDGINLHAPSFLSYRPGTSQALGYALFLLSAASTVAAAVLCRVHFDSMRGLLSLAARDNEIRVEYLGASVRRVAFGNFVRISLSGPARASSCSSPSSPAIRASSPSSWRRSCSSSCALFRVSIFPTAGRWRSAFSCCSSFCSCRRGSARCCAAAAAQPPKR
jgi:ABC-type branched-subunit amino acid transport system permease subunit